MLTVSQQQKLRALLAHELEWDIDDPRLIAVAQLFDYTIPDEEMVTFKTSLDKLEEGGSDLEAEAACYNDLNILLQRFWFRSRAERYFKVRVEQLGLILGTEDERFDMGEGIFSDPRIGIDDGDAVVAGEGRVKAEIREARRLLKSTGIFDAWSLAEQDQGVKCSIWRYLCCCFGSTVPRYEYIAVFGAAFERAQRRLEFLRNNLQDRRLGFGGDNILLLCGERDLPAGEREQLRALGIEAATEDQMMRELASRYLADIVAMDKVQVVVGEKKPGARRADTVDTCVAAARILQQAEVDRVLCISDAPNCATQRAQAKQGFEQADAALRIDVVGAGMTAEVFDSIPVVEQALSAWAGLVYTIKNRLEHNLEQRRELGAGAGAPS